MKWTSTIISLQALWLVSSLDLAQSRKSTLALVPTRTSTSINRVGRERANEINANTRKIGYAMRDKKRSLLPFGSAHIHNNIPRGNMIVRGGANSVDSNENGSSNAKRNKILIAVVLSCLVATGVCNREAIASFDFKGKLASNLDILASKGTRGLVMYTVAFMLWEITVGVTTPVETAAGMAFGLKKGFIANAIGKTSGATIAFLLGRYVLKDAVESKLEGNEYMELVQDSIVKTPVRVALIWRFSFLPEQIKNFGLAVLPVKLWQFVLAVCMHGLPFTTLWSFLGNEMGLIVRGVVDGPSRTLKFLLGGVYVFGFFISPSMVGLWIKGLRDEKLKKDEAAKKKK